jgi:hypothetical protein
MLFMSEYQYYEFQAIDQPLSSDARQEMQRLSSRVQLTATSASFVYNYGDFRGNPYRVLVKYFDAMLYITNWGTRQLMFRFPRAALDREVLEPYALAESFSITEEDNYLILDIESNDENGDSWEWVEGEGWLSGLVQLREDIMQGDLRALYLAWLKAANEEYELLEDDEDLTEPPVPPRLGTLSPALKQFIDFFELDEDLVTVAAQASPDASPSEKAELGGYLDQLSPDEMRGFLQRVLHGERHLDIALTNRLREFISSTEPAVSLMPGRTLRALVSQAESIEKARLAKESRQAEAVRLKRLAEVAKQESKLWAQVSELVAQKQVRAYDEAVDILKDLRDLAKHESRLADFEKKVQSIREQNPTLSGLHRRMRDAKLI